jgi:hypothetical protein
MERGTNPEVKTVDRPFTTGKGREGYILTKSSQRPQGGSCRVAKLFAKTATVFAAESV